MQDSLQKHKNKMTVFFSQTVKNLTYSEGNMKKNVSGTGTFNISNAMEDGNPGKIIYH